MESILKKALALCCLMCSTTFAKGNVDKIYIPQDMINLKAGKIFVGQNTDSLRVKAIHSSQHGFYIYRDDALLQKMVAKGYVYGCTECSTDFYSYEKASVHVIVAHKGRGRLYIKRKE
jgi:hypothetical protein